VHVYVFPLVRPETVIGLFVPTADFLAPPLLDEHVAVYSGVVSGLPFVPAVDRFVNVTRKCPDDVFEMLGFATCAGAPATTAFEADDG
jgi:hypothetical protein